MITIDKNIPRPDRIKIKGRPGKYPWTQMEIGDSFFVADTSVKKFNTGGATKRTGHKYSVRTEGAGVRVWRME